MYYLLFVYLAYVFYCIYKNLFTRILIVLTVYPIEGIVNEVVVK